MKHRFVLILGFASCVTLSGAAPPVTAGQGGSVFTTNRPPAHAKNSQPYNRQTVATPRRSFSMGPSSGAWPNYPNYGNPVGAAYSRAAGMRQGQWFGTFGLHPADAKARGAY